ncbi:DUF4222 domain-containing protein [Citrobacter telavivensis]|uniref:DUF4222 domain-containing protein n=1 Tax=Citrobacter telavivensis TaxID=2653932 RepID=UPI00359D9904
MMKNKTGLISGGKTQPEIRPGDIWKDSHGSVITVSECAHNRVIYYRDGYDSPCICSPDRLRREFVLVTKAPPADSSDFDRIMNVTGSERIRVMWEIIQERGKQK